MAVDEKNIIDQVSIDEDDIVILTSKRIEKSDIATLE
jgi:hypothetical protein